MQKNWRKQMITSTTQVNRKGTDEGTWALVVFFLLTFAVILLLMFWPLTKQFIPGLADPPVITAMGKVQKVTFVGGFGTRTQVRTSTSTVLLRRAVELTVGADVERRSSAISEQLCLVGRDRCVDISSR
jgi:hypothetical protein